MGSGDEGNMEEVMVELARSLTLKIVGQKAMEGVLTMWQGGGAQTDNTNLNHKWDFLL